MPRLIDAHCHLQDGKLGPVLEEVFDSQIESWIVNGTRPEDWDAVADLAERDSRVIPAFGWHPWQLSEPPEQDSFSLLGKFLQTYPKAHVGEVGVDRWKRGLNDDIQIDALARQLEIAAEYSRPITVHCLKAWGLLESAWKRTSSHPKRILLHAFNGSLEIAETWVKRGSYFSFSTYFLHPKKQGTRDVFAALPLERLLVETDAPAMSPPDELGVRQIEPGINHPLNLELAYRALADLKSLSFEDLAKQVSSNFNSFAQIAK